MGSDTSYHNLGCPLLANAYGMFSPHNLIETALEHKQIQKKIVMILRLPKKGQS